MSKQPLPLDSPKWQPINSAYRQLRHQLGSDWFALAEINAALKAGQLRSLIRHGRTGSFRQLLLCLFWSDFEMTFGVSDGLRLKGKTKQLKVDYAVIYVWGPDVKKLWPEAAVPSKPSRAPAELAATLKRLPAELTAALKPLIESNPATPNNKAKAENPQPSLQRQVADAILKRRYPHGVPDNVRTATVRKEILGGKEILGEWEAECKKREISPKLVPPPSWHTVNRMLGREE